MNYQGETRILTWLGLIRKHPLQLECLPWGLGLFLEWPDHQGVDGWVGAYFENAPSLDFIQCKTLAEFVYKKLFVVIPSRF
jgi:hypothetical protein